MPEALKGSLERLQRDYVNLYVLIAANPRSFSHPSYL